MDLLYLLILGLVAVVLLDLARQSASEAPAPTHAAPGSSAPGHLGSPVLGKVPLGGLFTCAELRSIGYPHARLVSAFGGPELPTVAHESMLGPTERTMLREMHADGRVYGHELMRFIHHGGKLDLTREALVFAHVGDARGTIALLIKPDSGALQLVPPRRAR